MVLTKEEEKEYLDMKGQKKYRFLRGFFEKYSSVEYVEYRSEIDYEYFHYKLGVEKAQEGLYISLREDSPLAVTIDEAERVRELLYTEEELRFKILYRQRFYTDEGMRTLETSWIDTVNKLKEHEWISELVG